MRPNILFLALALALAAPSQTFAQKKEERSIVCRETRADDTSITLEFTGPREMDLRVSQHPKVTLTPEVKGGIEISIGRRSLTLSGRFIPETMYTVRIPKESIVSGDGSQMKRDVFLQVRTPRETPGISFLTDGTYFPIHAKNFSIPIKVKNMREINICLWRLYNDNLDSYSDMSPTNVDDYGEPLARKKIAVPPGPGEKIFPLDLEDLIGKKEPGVYALLAQDPEAPYLWYWSRMDSRFLIVTDLAVSAALDPDGGTADVFVHSISKGSPMEDALVRILSRKGRILAEGTTKNGLVRLRLSGSHDLSGDPVGRCVVRRGKDATILPLVYEGLTLSGNGGLYFKPGCRAFTYTERDVVRPGETFHASAFLRQTGADGKWETPDGVPVRLMLASPSGKIIAEKSVTSGKEGFLSAAFTIPESAPTGMYRILCGLSPEQVFGECSIMAAAYMPDRIRVGLTASQKTAFPGQKVDFAARAEYYFGGEIPSESAWKFKVSAARPLTPDFWKGWTVGEKPELAILSTFQESKESKGSALPKNLTWPVPDEGSLTVPMAYAASLSVTEPGGRAVTGFDHVEVYPTRSYIGVRRTGDPGSGSLELTLLPWKKDEAVEAEDVKITLFRKQWEYVLMKNGNNFLREWECRSIPLKGILPEKIRLAAEPVRLPLTGLASGEYEIVAGSGRRKTVFTFFHSCGEAGGRAMDPRRLTLKTDKEKYAPGDTAKMELDVPKDSFALVVHGETGAEQTIRKNFVQGGRQTVEIPIRANANSEAWHGTVTLVSRAKTGELQRSFAFFTLKVDMERNRLIPALTIPEVLRPGETLKGEVRLADPSGAPRGGLVHIFAVDEGILALSDFRTPDIFHAFYGPRRWNVEIHDIYELLYPDLKLLPDGTIGGGEGSASALSKRLEAIKKKAPAVVVAPPVTVPGSGVASWSFTLPDHTGALRVMAVAVSGPSVGSAEKQIVLRDEATAMVSRPQTVSPGDEFDVTVTVHNMGLSEKDEITVNVEAPELFTLKDPPEWKLCVPRNSSATRAFRCRAGDRTGSADFRIRLRGGPVDRVREEPVTIRTGGALERRSEVRLLGPGSSLEIAFPATEWKRADHALSVMGQPAASAAFALEYLEKYPYGCVEQRTSGIFPYLAMQDLIKAGLLDPRSEGTIRDRLETASAELLSMIRSDGSFPMWQGGSAWNEASVYASLFFFEAQARGSLQIDQALLNNMRSYLRGLVQSSSLNAFRMLRASACYALAAASDEAFLRPARNLLAADSLDFASILASLALIRGGYAAEGAARLNELMESGVWLSPGSVFSCGRPGYGMLLTLLLENAPDDKRIPAVAARLLEQIRDGSNPWGNTQENAWAARGLAAFAARFPAKPCRIRMEKDGASRVLEAPEKVPVKPDKKIRLVNEGEGATLIRTESEGIPVTPRNVGGPIRLTRAYLDHQGIPVREVRHGETLTVLVTMNAPRPLEDAVLCCILPAGLEIEDGTLATREKERPSFSRGLVQKSVERRDDRFLVFFNVAKGMSEIRFTVRAVTRGVFSEPPCTVEEMYDPDMFGVLPGSGPFQVK